MAEDKDYQAISMVEDDTNTGTWMRGAKYIILQTLKVRQTDLDTDRRTDWLTGWLAEWLTEETNLMYRVALCNEITNYLMDFCGWNF